MSTVIYPAFLEQDLSALVPDVLLRTLKKLYKNEWVDNKRSPAVSQMIGEQLKPVFRFVYQALEINGWKKISADDPRAHVYVESVFMTGEKVDRVLQDVRDLAKMSARNLSKDGKSSPLLTFLQSMQSAAKQVYERERYGKLLKPKEKTAEQEAAQKNKKEISCTFTFDS